MIFVFSRSIFLVGILFHNLHHPYIPLHFEEMIFPLVQSSWFHGTGCRMATLLASADTVIVRWLLLALHSLTNVVTTHTATLHCGVARKIGTIIILALHPFADDNWCVNIRFTQTLPYTESRERHGRSTVATGEGLVLAGQGSHELV